MTTGAADAAIGPAGSAGDEVLLEVADGIATITLNRPDKLNAENLGWVGALERQVEKAARDPDAQLVVVRGAGRAFCAGLDRDMLAQGGMPDGFYAGQERAFRGLETMDKITIAAVHGYCIGGGLQLAIACDLRVCAADAVLGLPAVDEGLFPGLAPFRLPRLIGLGAARRLVLSGERVDPSEALRLGLVDHLLPAESFDDDLARLLADYRAGPTEAMRASKRLFAMAYDESLAQAFTASVGLLADCLEAPAVQSASAAWLARR